MTEQPEMTDRERQDYMFTMLAEPFTDEELEWRVLRKGKGAKGIWCQLAAYVDSRAIQNRLDQVVGPDNWQNTIDTIQVAPVGGDDKAGTGIVVALGIRIGSEWIWKRDGADFSRGMEITKSGISDGLKRAASLWGIGRWLYTIPQQWGKNVSGDKAPYGRSDILIFKHEDKKYWCETPKLNAGAGDAKPTQQNSPPPETISVKSEPNGNPKFGASEFQVKLINELLDERDIPLEEIANINEAVGKGITQVQAGDLINSLQGRAMRAA